MSTVPDHVHSNPLIIPPLPSESYNIVLNYSISLPTISLTSAYSKLCSGEGLKNLVMLAPVAQSFTLVKEDKVEIPRIEGRLEEVKETYLLTPLGELEEEEEMREMKSKGRDVRDRIWFEYKESIKILGLFEKKIEILGCQTTNPIDHSSIYETYSPDNVSFIFFWCFFLKLR
jgi:hypothetical protein